MEEKPSSRPSSYYDNYNGGEEPQYNKELPSVVELKNLAQDEEQQECTPTQECLLKTTVPQNMAGINIAGKHTPTRNSLRHSRMIVMSRTGHVARAYQTHIVGSYKLATTLAAFQLILGISISCLAAWLLLWTPSLRRRDNPYWSGLPLLGSGTVALLLLCCCRKGRPGSLKGYFVNGFKIFSITLTLIATAAALIASVFAGIHLISLSLMECDSTQFLNETCVCKLMGNTTQAFKSYHYADLKCPQVYHALRALLVFSCAANAFAGAICLWYVYLLCNTKKQYRYSKVKTKSDKHNTIVISKK